MFQNFRQLAVIVGIAFFIIRSIQPLRQMEVFMIVLNLIFANVYQVLNVYSQPLLPFIPN